jgi:hypothetical protein
VYTGWGGGKLKEQGDTKVHDGRGGERERERGEKRRDKGGGTIEGKELHKKKEHGTMCNRRAQWIQNATLHCCSKPGSKIQRSIVVPGGGVSPAGMRASGMWLPCNATRTRASSTMDAKIRAPDLGAWPSISKMDCSKCHPIFLNLPLRR